jgi:hypothetical protein
MGHFDDPRSAECPAGVRRQRCADRFVVDTVAWDEGASLADFPGEVAGLPVITVSRAIAERETDLTREVAVAGWYREPAPMFCPSIPDITLPFLEGSCSISQTWLLETPESIVLGQRGINIGRVTGPGPLGPAINPVFPTVMVPAGRPLPAAGGSTPTPAILIGHFNDPRSSLCVRDAPPVCLGRFVVDAVPWVEGIERTLPQRTDSRGQATAPAFDPIRRVREVAGNVGTVLNVAAVSGAELVRIEPGFDLLALHESVRSSFWIVTGAIYGPAVPTAGRFVVDEQGVVFFAYGTHFELVGSPRPSPGRS